MTDDELILCEASDWNGEPTYCRWCNKPLPKLRRRWCSDNCGNEFGRHHWWSWASAAAIKRDGDACVRCGVKAANDAGGNWPRDRQGRLMRFEVHHKTPILGRHGESGCHHHLDGLETLCGDCHHDEHHGIRKEAPERFPGQLTLQIRAA
jgi:hypothetical protein